MEVRVRQHEDSSLAGQAGVIRGLSAGMCAVYLPHEDRVVNVLADLLEPAVPQSGDRVKVYTLRTLLTGEKGSSLITKLIIC